MVDNTLLQEAIADYDSYTLQSGAAGDRTRAIRDPGKFEGETRTPRYNA